MANLVKAPTSDTTLGISEIPVPVPFTTELGLLPAIASESISSAKIAPKMRTISSGLFATGAYTFPTPATYVPRPYTLPMLEPKSWEVDGQSIDAYVPVSVYRLGDIESGDTLGSDFPIRIGAYLYGENNEYVPFTLNQTVRIIAWKSVGVKINWAQSNIVNNGMPDTAIEASQLLVFDVTNREGIFSVASWIYPNFMYEGLNNLDLNGATTLAEILTAINDRTTTAGGDLTGEYPNPAIKDGTVTTQKLADNAVTPIKMKPIDAKTFLGNRNPISWYPSAIAAPEARELLNVDESIYSTAKTANPSDNYQDREVVGVKFRGYQVYEASVSTIVQPYYGDKKYFAVNIVSQPDIADTTKIVQIEQIGAFTTINSSGARNQPWLFGTVEYARGPEARLQTASYCDVANVDTVRGLYANMQFAYDNDAVELMLTVRYIKLPEQV